MIGQAEFFITAQGTRRTYGACLMTQHMHGSQVNHFVAENTEEIFPSFDLGFDFLNDQNNAETATD